MRVLDGSKSSIISIHALLAESDTLDLPGWLRVLISIHALLAESDRGAVICYLDNIISIHALLAESDVTVLGIQHRIGISIHALLAESDANAVDQILPGHISIHALLAESDHWQTKRHLKSSRISIHALLAESDTMPSSRHIGKANFYPRSPCGERLGNIKNTSLYKLFLSTLSLRRATAKVHKTVGHFCAYETNFMGIASSC